MTAPSSLTETKFLQELLGSGYFWINCIDPESGVFECKEGMRVIHYRAWLILEPSHGFAGGGQCVEVWGNGEWNDAPCGYKNLAVCKKSITAMLHI